MDLRDYAYSDHIEVRKLFAGKVLGIRDSIVEAAFLNQCSSATLGVYVLRLVVGYGSSAQLWVLTIPCHSSRLQLSGCDSEILTLGRPSCHYITSQARSSRTRGLERL